MSDIHDLEQRLQKLEDAFSQQSGKIDQLLEKSDKALDLALHAYKVDHYGYIWQYDCETKEYVKSNMRVCTPEIADRALHSRHIADGAVEGRHLQDDCIGEKQIKDNSIPGDKFEGKVFKPGKLADEAVSTRNLQNEAVTPSKLHPCVIPFVVKPFIHKYDHEICKLKAKDADLQNQIDSFNEHGVSVSNVFGTDQHVGVSQKTLTDAFNKLWQKIEDITGDALQGISMTVTPDYFISEDGCSVHITANTVETNGIFEHIAFYANGSLIAEADNVHFFEYDTELTETTVIRCVAKIMGIEYPRQAIVTHYNSFWLGAGATYQDIMDVEHVIPITSGLRGQHEVTAAADDRIFIILGESLRSAFLRADISFTEINFTEQEVTVDGKTYCVLTSENTYEAGTFKVFING